MTPHRLAEILDSQLPSPTLSLKMPPKLPPPPHKRGHFVLFQNCPCGEGTSSGNFCLAALGCLSVPSGDPDTFEKYRDTFLISVAILLQKYALLLAESSICTTIFYHDTAPTCFVMLLRKYLGQGSLEHPPNLTVHSHMILRSKKFSPDRK